MNKTLSLTDGLGSYFTRISNIPLLSHEEEIELATRVAHDDDMEAARTLVLSHLRFVAYIAKRYSHYGLPLEDLIQEGNISLLRAVENYDVIKYPNVRFASYAVIYIKGAIREYVIKNWKIINVATTKVQRKLFSNLRSMKTNLGVSSEEEANSIAETLNVPVKDVRIMEERMYTNNPSFDPIGNDENDDFDVSPSNYLYKDGNNPETLVEDEQYQEFTNKKVMSFIDELGDRDRDIILSRYFIDIPISQTALANKYNVSPQRVAQLEMRIIKNLKKMVEEL